MMKIKGYKEALLLTVIVIMLSACGHTHEYDSGVVTTEPTCTTEGVKTYTCTQCKKTKEEPIPVIEHTWTKGEITKAATCTEEGIQEKKCSVCGLVSSDSIPKTAHKYKEEITKEPTFKEEGVKTYTCSVCGDKYTETIPVRDDEVLVTVIDKESEEKDYSINRYSPWVGFKITVENMTKKDIQGVKGVMKVSDLFGTEILSINCDFTGKTIPVGETVEFDDLGIEINEFMNPHVKLFNTDYDDLKFDYTIDNVVYADGGSKNDTSTSDSTAMSSKEVMVVVTGKESLDKNYSAGRYSLRCEFSFDVTNNTDRDIKGVQGTLNCMDLFGEPIQSIGCDFTGKTIPAGETVKFSELGIDINEFVSEDLKLFNEEYEDLKFSYDVSDVVYAD